MVNVGLIGAQGVGKTSLILCLEHCLKTGLINAASCYANKVVYLYFHSSHATAGFADWIIFYRPGKTRPGPIQCDAVAYSYFNRKRNKLTYYRN